MAVGDPDHAGPVASRSRPSLGKRDLTSMDSFQPGDGSDAHVAGRSARSPRVWWLCWFIVLALGTAIKSLQSPLYLFGTGDDDELMVRMAQGFLHGRWSSSWSSTGAVTLAKPVGYPLFLAGAHFLPWSPVLSAYLVYLVGVVLIARSWSRISRSYPQATLILVALTCNPIFFTVQSQRIYRDIYIAALATVAIGIAFTMAGRVVSLRPFADSEGITVSEPARPPGWFAVLTWGLLALLLGGLIGLVVVTKPTWQWILIALAAPLCYPLARTLHGTRHRLSTLLRVGLVGLLVVMSAYGVVETVKQFNERTYGVHLVEGFSSGALARTWKLWAGVEAGSRQRYVQITKAMRLAVYNVSPTAATLRPYLESPTNFWNSVDCASNLHICDDPGNWMEWDLQDAAVASGHVHSPRQFQSFFNQIGDDIEKACNSGRLRCSSSPVLATGLPPLDQISLGAVALTTASGTWRQLQARLPMGNRVGPKPTVQQYKLWASVIPNMASFGSVSSGSTPRFIGLLLEVLDLSYRLSSWLFLLAILAGCALWAVAVARRRRRTTHESELNAAVASTVFLISSLLGMVTLAVFQVARGRYTYVAPLYWADFATPAELFLVLGAIAAWPRIRRLLRSPPAAAATDHSESGIRRSAGSAHTDPGAGREGVRGPTASAPHVEAPRPL